MRYGVVGTGYWGENHVRVASELAAEDVLDEVVVCDVDEARAAELAGTHNLEYVTDAAQLAVDAATVATPSPTHEAIATDLLEGGTDVLVEKPLALDADAAWNVVRTAASHDRTLGVGHIFRYHPALRELKRRIDAGELGDLRYLHTVRFSFRVPRDTTGVLYSLAVHDVDIYNYLLGGQPTALYCQRDAHLRDGIDEAATVQLQYDAGEQVADTGASGVIHSSWQVPVFGKRRDLAVVGTDAAAAVDYRRDTEIELFETAVRPDVDGDLTLHDGGSTVYELADAEPLKREVRAFVRAVRDGTEPLASGAVGARTVELLERAEESDAKDEVVVIEEPRSVPQ
jgi:UDP-N-acetylglucosamine 3-dehydrogenase